MKKIVTLDTIIATVPALQSQGRKLVFASGAFDLFHYGHFRALQKASEAGDMLIVQIDGNDLVRNRKGASRPHLDETDRARMVASLEFVHAVFISNTPAEDPQTLISVAPDIFIRAIIPGQSRQEQKKREKRLQKFLPKGKVLWIAQTPEISTTKLIPLLTKQAVLSIPALHGH